MVKLLLEKIAINNLWC